MAEARPSQPRTSARDGYRPIHDYGVIGNMRTAALVAKDGSIDWYCAPRFDSPSIFAALLDAEKGGRFLVAPAQRFESRQAYLGDTNVLVTTFETNSGTAKLTDFMPCLMDKASLRASDEVHRQVECTSGVIDFVLSFLPRLNYASRPTNLVRTNAGCYGKSANQLLSLSSSTELRRVEKTSASHDFRLKEGERAVFVVRYGTSDTRPVSSYETGAKLSRTVEYWKNWAGHVAYDGPYRSQVVRSCLVLKLLQYSPTGAMVAAVTTSVPEWVGGARNWDYRFSWIRDAAFSIWALTAVGVTGEAMDYARWLAGLHRSSKGKLEIMRTVTGARVAPERILDHLEGYCGSSPVRVGNSARDQVQLDIYGILIDSLFYLHHALGRTPRQIYQTLVRPSADYVLEHWQRPDSGIWEMRLQQRLFVESRMWCYIALDRASKLARELGYSEDPSRWEPVKRKIKSEILSRGWSERKKSFTMEFDGENLDAANLLMPIAKFLPARHPKVQSTVQRIIDELSSGDLVWRYTADDGLPGKEGAFTVCSFWLVDCLARLGRVGEAERLFGRLLRRGNHLGLFSEEIDPANGQALGNFPQAYTHTGLINAAVRLEEARRKLGWKRYVTSLSRKVTRAKNVDTHELVSAEEEYASGVMQLPQPVGHGPHFEPDP